VRKKGVSFFDFADVNKRRIEGTSSPGQRGWRTWRALIMPPTAEKGEKGEGLQREVSVSGQAHGEGKREKKGTPSVVQQHSGSGNGSAVVLAASEGGDCHAKRKGRVFRVTGEGFFRKNTGRSKHSLRGHGASGKEGKFVGDKRGSSCTAARGVLTVSSGTETADTERLRRRGRRAYLKMEKKKGNPRPYLVRRGKTLRSKERGSIAMSTFRRMKVYLPSKLFTIGGTGRGEKAWRFKAGRGGKGGSERGQRGTARTQECKEVAVAVPLGKKKELGGKKKGVAWR